MGDCFISDNVDDTLITFALASCVALIVYYPTKKVLGMAHIVLPDSGLGQDFLGSKPGYFADKAVTALFTGICSTYRYCLNQLVVSIYGGADSINHNDVFLIGKRNIASVSRILDNHGIPYYDKETGGKVSRTVEADVATGKVRVKMQPLII